MENKKTMRIRGLISIAVLAMFFFLYNICLFVINGFLTGLNNGACFWTSYAMMIMSFGITGIVLIIATLMKSEPKDAFLRFPIFYHAIVFLVLELISTSFFMALDVFFGLRFLWFVSVPVSLIISTVHIAIVVSCFFVKNHIQKLDDKVKDKNNFIKLLKVDVDVIAESAVDPEVREAYMGLSEQVRYSDPMSHDSLFELEKQILECLGFSKRCVEEGKNEAALQNCEIASRLLFERNEKTKALK